MKLHNVFYKKKHLIFLGILFLVGVLTILPYGFYLDQGTEQRIMFANIKEYMIQFGLEGASLVQEMTDADVLEISIDEDRDHGMAVYYPAFPIWYLKQYSPYLGSLCWHIYTFVLVFWGMCSLFFLGKVLFESEKLAGFMVLLFFLTPRMFAESHYNNKDVVLLSLLFSMMYYGYRLMRKTTWGNVCLLSFTGALATNLKVVGAFMFGVIGLYCLGYLIAHKSFNKKVIGKAMACVVLWFVLYIFMSPAAWNDIMGYFDYLISYALNYVLWHDYILFDGRMIHKDYTGIPKKYLPVMILLTVPVGILLLAVIGGLVAVIIMISKKKLWDREGYICMGLLIGAVPLLFAVSQATPVYNGWRHFYFVYMSIVLGAGYGAYFLWQLAGRYKKEKQVGVVGLGYLLLLALGIVINYPQEHSFYNVLAGKDVVNNFELDYWDMCVKQAMEAVCDQVAEGEKVSVGATNLPTMWGLQGNHDLLQGDDRQKLAVIEDVTEWREAEYVIVNTTYALMYSREAYDEIKQNYGLVEDFTSYGNVICEVYRKQ